VHGDDGCVGSRGVGGAGGGRRMARAGRVCGRTTGLRADGGGSGRPFGG